METVSSSKDAWRLEFLLPGRSTVVQNRFFAKKKIENLAIFSN